MPIDVLRQAKDVVKALKKRLQHKSPRVQQLALTVLKLGTFCSLASSFVSTLFDSLLC